MSELRRATAQDGPIILTMTEETMNWDLTRPRESLAEVARTYPEIMRYTAGWGRPGDEGFVAEEGEEPVGAAWYRLFPADAPAFGFIDEATPEIGIALAPEARGHGIGTALLAALFDLAHGQGFSQISLSVAIANPARRLYERFGFVKVEDDDDGYRKMVLDLSSRRRTRSAGRS